MDISISAYKSSGQQISLNAGDIVYAASAKAGRNGSYILNINGRNVEAFSKDLLFGNNLKLMVLKTNPLEVELLKQQSTNNSLFQMGDKVSVKILSSNNGIFSVEIGGKTYTAGILANSGNARIMAEVIKTEPLLTLKEINISPKNMALSAMAKEISVFNQKETATILKEFGAIHLSSFMADDIKKTLRNSGQFFEYKLSKGLSLDGDMKLAAYTQQNSSAESAISKLQIANALMSGDFFSFFENDELDFDDGIIKAVKNSGGSYSVYIKMNFTKIGETIISIIRHYENSYLITVRSKVNITAELSRLRIKNCKVVWKEMNEKDSEFFQIKKENLKEMNGFERIG